MLDWKKYVSYLLNKCQKTVVLFTIKAHLSISFKNMHAYIMWAHYCVIAFYTTSRNNQKSGVPYVSSIVIIFGIDLELKGQIRWKLII